MISLGRALIVVPLVFGLGCEPSEPVLRVPTSIDVVPLSRTVGALRLTERYTARVRDQHGDAIPHAYVRWRTSDAGVAAVTDSGDVTSVGPGSATITASILGLSGAAQITVRQVAAQLYVMDGNAQTGPAFRPLPVPIVIRVIDSAGAPAAGVPVTFTPEGGGRATASAVSDVAGQVTAIWTLGGAPGKQSLSVAVADPVTITLHATALLAPAPQPDMLIKETADVPCHVPSATVQPTPAVRVRDQLGVPYVGAVVTFAVTMGTGDVTGPIQVTDSRGMARVGSWVPTSSGWAELTASVSDSGVVGNPVVFVANARATPEAHAVIRQSPEWGTASQQGNAGRPAVLVQDQFGNEMGGIVVTFRATGQGSFVAGPDQLTNAGGIAAPTQWFLQTPGTHELTATVSSSSTCPVDGNPVGFYVSWP